MSQTIEGGTGYLTPAGTPVTALAPEHDEVQQKFLGALLPGLVSMLPQLINAGAQVAGSMGGGRRRARRKDYDAGASFADDGESFAEDEEAQQKFLGALLPGLVSVLPQLINAGAQVAGSMGGGRRRARRKDFDAGASFADEGEAFADDPEAQQKFLGALLPGLVSVLPQLINAGAQVAGSMGGGRRRARRKDYDAGASFADDGESFAEDEEAQQKFLGGLLRHARHLMPRIANVGAHLAPQVLHALPQVLGAVGAAQGGMPGIMAGMGGMQGGVPYPAPRRHRARRKDFDAEAYD